LGLFNIVLSNYTIQGGWAKFVKFSTAELVSLGLTRTVLARKFYKFSTTFSMDNYN